MNKLRSFLLAAFALSTLSLFTLILLFSTYISKKRPHFYFSGEVSCEKVLSFFNPTFIPRIASLTPQDVTSDLNYLVALIDKVYAGKHGLPPNTYQSLIQSIEQLKSAPISSSNLLANRLSEIFKKVPDNHLRVTSISNHLKPLVDSLKPLKENRLEKTVFQGKPALKLTLYHFLSSVEEWETFLQEVEENLNSSEAIFIDMRNHIGGRLDYAHELSALLYGVGLNGQNFTQYFPMLLNSTLTYSTPLSSTGATIINDQLQLFITKTEESEKIESPICLGPKATASVTHNPSDFLHELYDPELIYPHPIFLITGRNCHSACEIMVSNLLQHPNVTTVGKNTAGTIHFVNPLIYSLPNSQITVMIPNTFVQFKNNIFVEKIGFEPMKKMSDDQIDAMF